jgi:hypothetical protein
MVEAAIFQSKSRWRVWHRAARKGKAMKPMHGIYDGKSIKLLDPVPVDRPIEVEIVPIGPAPDQATLTREDVRAKLAVLFATLQGLSEEQQAALDGTRLDQARFFRPDSD